MDTNLALEKYKLAFEISPVPMLLVSCAGNIELVNSSSNSLFGYQSKELVGQSVEVLIPDAGRTQHAELRDAYFRMPTKRAMGMGRDLYGRTRSGATIPLELALEPVSIGAETWAMVAAVDIRPRKAHEERLRQAMDAAASAMIMTNEAGRIVFVNRAAITLLGYQESELLDSSVDRLVPEAARRSHSVYRNSFTSAGLSRAMGADRRVVAVHQDGTEIPVEIALAQTSSADGRLVLCTITDLTERMAAERMLRARADEMEGLNKELSDFAYSASHDLKAPLSTITGLLELCLEELEEGNLTELGNGLRKAQQTGRRSLERVENVLRVARASQEAVLPERFNLRELIFNIWQDMNVSHDESQELVLALEAGDILFSERPGLQIILENLLSNALRYRDHSKDRMTVGVSSKRLGQMVEFRVSDNGIGISADRQPHIFDMFKRLDDRSLDGLGLTLVKKQVERLGGTIKVESKQGQGTQFWFSVSEYR
ncbi:MAG: PAS domain S-box protein [Burkholderiaceae bacterium]